MRNARVNDRPASRRALGLLRREHVERTESKLYHVAGKAITVPVRNAPGSVWCLRNPGKLLPNAGIAVIHVARRKVAA